MALMGSAALSVLSTTTLRTPAVMAAFMTFLAPTTLVIGASMG